MRARGEGQPFFAGLIVFDSSQRSTSVLLKRTFWASLINGMERLFISLSRVPRLIRRYSISSALVRSSGAGMAAL